MGVFPPLGAPGHPGEEVSGRVGFGAGRGVDEFFSGPGDQGHPLRPGRVRGHAAPRRLDYREIRRNPKLFIGFSDITVLLLAFWKKARLLTFHGPMVTTLARLTAASRDRFRFTLRGILGESLPLPRPGKIHGGRAQGWLLGGNLTLLAHLIGTPFEPDWDRAILFVEDEGEPGYRLDRLFVHLKLAGVLGRIRGLLLGRLNGPGLMKKDFELIRETFADLDIPIWQGLPVGHGRQNWTLPVGAPVELDGERGLLRFLGDFFVH